MYFMVLLYIFYPLSPNTMLCFMKIFVITAMVECVCIYIYIFVRIYKVPKKNLHINGVKISILESYAYMSRYPIP